MSMPITAGTSRSWRVRPNAGNARDAPHRSQEFLILLFPRVYLPVKNVDSLAIGPLSNVRFEFLHSRILSEWSEWSEAVDFRQASSMLEGWEGN